MSASFKPSQVSTVNFGKSMFWKEEYQCILTYLITFFKKNGDSWEKQTYKSFLTHLKNGDPGNSSFYDLVHSHRVQQVIGFLGIMALEGYIHVQYDKQPGQFMGCDYIWVSEKLIEFFSQHLMA